MATRILSKTASVASSSGLPVPELSSSVVDSSFFNSREKHMN